MWSDWWLVSDWNHHLKLWLVSDWNHDFWPVIGEWLESPFFVIVQIPVDGPFGWSKGWVSFGRDRHRWLRHQQGGGGIRIWAGIIGGVLVGPWRVPEGVKMTAETYIAFLQQNFESWFKKQKVTFKRTMILMRDNATSHAARKRLYLQQLGLCGHRKMNLPASSPDLNPIQNFCSMLNRKVYENGCQVTSKAVLWSAIVDVCRSFTSGEIQNLTGSMDNWLLHVISKKGSSLPNC